MQIKFLILIYRLFILCMILYETVISEKYKHREKLLFLGIFSRKKKEKVRSQMSYKSLSSCSVYVNMGI